MPNEVYKNIYAARKSGLHFPPQRLSPNLHAVEGEPFLAQVLQRGPEMIDGVVDVLETNLTQIYHKWIASTTLRSWQAQPCEDAKRQWGRSQERVQRKVFRVGMTNLVLVGRGGRADMAGKRPLCGEDR